MQRRTNRFLVTTIRERAYLRWVKSAGLIRPVPVAIVIIAALLAPAASAANGGWDLQPYRIHAVIAIDTRGGFSEQLAAQLPEYLQRRVDATLAPSWNFDAAIVTGKDCADVLKNLDATSPAKPLNVSLDVDKHLSLSIVERSTGVELSAREYDHYVERWGPCIRRECRQASALPEQLFALARRTVAPLAQIEVDPKDAKQLTLKPRGGALPRAAGGQTWAAPGDVFVPILRRTSRNGQLVENGIQVVPWTYIEAVADKDQKLAFRTVSGSRQSLAARRQGRVEQLALAIRAEADATTLRLHARKNEKKPLVGYEVLLQSRSTEPPTRIALSDAAGEVAVRPGKNRVEMLIVKHGGQLLAKLPVVPGAERYVNVPLPDDDARLAAEARLAALREDLIDVVARRNILIARARQKIKRKDFASAEELLRTLDELPGKPQFENTLNSSERLLRSDDPIMQNRIKQLFSQTRTLTNQFLDMKPINEIHNELREARTKPPVESKKT